MHHYYYNPNTLDLAKIRSDAQSRLDGTGTYRGAREESIIHLHLAKDDCHLILDDGDEFHEMYREKADETSTTPV